MRIQVDAQSGKGVKTRCAESRIPTVAGITWGALKTRHAKGLALKLIKPSSWRWLFVCVFSSRSFWTSSSLDVPAGVTQEEGHTGYLIHLPSAVRALVFLVRRIQPFLSLVDREVEYCVLTI